jgi:GNAT superfamily N-acetyltransferase
VTREEASQSPVGGQDPTDAKSHGFVRAARASDAADLARVQVASWRSAYVGVVPQDVLAELTSTEAEALWRDRWHEAITKPPTSRHRVLVAVEESAPESADERTVAGFAAAGPATDEDRWPATDAELYELRVPPEMTGHGHGSRLLNAVADTLADDGFVTLSTWVLEPDGALQRTLEDVGWAADGARRELDMGVPGAGGPVPLIRLHTTISQ